MSARYSPNNINPFPTFKPYTGKDAKAADGWFPYPARTLDQVWRGEEDSLSRSKIILRRLEVIGKRRALTDRESALMVRAIRKIERAA